MWIVATFKSYEIEMLKSHINYGNTVSSPKSTTDFVLSSVCLFMLTTSTRRSQRGHKALSNRGKQSLIQLLPIYFQHLMCHTVQLTTGSLLAPKEDSHYSAWKTF